MATGIVGFGAYIPKYRIRKEDIARAWGGGAAGVAEKSVADADEDTITMAVEAGQITFTNARIEPSAIGALYVASVSSPYIHNSMAAIIAQVLKIPASASLADFGGSTKASTEAMQACIDLIESGRVSLGMVIGTDSLLARPGDPLEHSLGVGSAAFILGKEDVIAEWEGSHSHVSTFVHTWRSDGDRFVREYNDPRLDRAFGYPRSITMAANGLMEKLGIKASEFNQVVLHQPDGQLPLVAAKEIGVAPQTLARSNLAPRIGDAGCGSVLIGLASALDGGMPSERILIVSYGSGAGSDAFSLKVVRQQDLNKDTMVPVSRLLETKEYVDYIKYGKLTGILRAEAMPDPISSYVTQPGWERDKRYTLGLHASRCRKCGSLNFPKRHYCIDCRGQEFEEVSLPRRGKIISFNIQQVVSVSPEEAPIPVCTARMDGTESERGGKISAMMTDTKPDELDIGLPVELIFRRCGQELGLVKYGYKFRLVKEREE
ncbi:hydroxymethylglutaryl-CoA synthase [Chloroflexota bacterium]